VWTAVWQAPKLLLGRGVGKNSPFALVYYVRGLRIGRGNRIIGRGRGRMFRKKTCRIQCCCIVTF